MCVDIALFALLLRFFNQNGISVFRLREDALIFVYAAAGFCV